MFGPPPGRISGHRILGNKKTATQRRTLSISYIIILCVLFACSVSANEAFIADNADLRQQCSGMYSRKEWGGNIDPYIKIALDRLDNTTTESAIVSLVVFEWSDIDRIGIDYVDAPSGKQYVCDDNAVNNKLCDSDQLGQFLLSGSDNGTIASVFTKAVNLNTDDLDSVIYEVKRTGFYCVGSYALSAEGYTGIVTFQNAFGNLPASQIAKLPFYGGIAIAYAVVLAFWMFLYVQYRGDILAVQNYITACATFLTIEMIVVWGYYDLVNANGHTLFSRFYMVFVAILNAFRNAFTFFLLLIVCLGYGVVKPTLGPTMLKCRILAGLHFVFGVVYVISSFVVTPDSAGPLILLVILPLAGTMTAFYVWILSSLTATIKDLTDRKQTVKALMYRRLWRLLFASILIIFGFFFVNSLIFADRNTPNFVPRHWKSRWFILDGWLNIVYFVDFTIIAFLWRPTANNRRFAMSDELSQEEPEGYEIASLAGSLDEEDRIGSSYDDVNRSANSNPYGADDDNDSLAGSLHHGISNPYGNARAAVETAAYNAGVDTSKLTEEQESETMFEAPDDYEHWSEDDDDSSNDGEASFVPDTTVPKKKEPGKDD
ncbi:lung seven transmembrane receptor-domain-containing protein [Lipomyces japonicus]|uniref:lung seven transmembrane receptor-domain-containing protein n=1 Tax=Lipomyces japonicus TaxID=56871 RepID=UPI0034CE1F81